jgi:hypothetical protein
VEAQGEPDSNDDGLLTRYLLGDLPEDERERLQAEYLADDALFARLLSAEDDLLDRYARGALAEPDRLRFEERFGQTPAQIRRVSFAHALRAATARRAAQPAQAAARLHRWRLRRASPMWAAAATALVALLAAKVWWNQADGPGRKVLRPATESPMTGTPSAQASDPDLNPSTPQPSVNEREATRAPDTSAAAVAKVDLRAGLVRAGGRAPELALSRATTSAELRLEIPADIRAAGHSRYVAVVETPSGVAVAAARGLAPDAGNAFVTLRVPAQRLGHRDYVVLLSAEKADGTTTFLRGYTFEVQHRP